MVILEELTDGCETDYPIATLSDLRVYRVGGAGFLDRTFPKGATICARVGLKARPNDLVVRRILGGPILTKFTASESAGSEMCANGGEVEVVIFWHRRFDHHAGPPSDPIGPWSAAKRGSDDTRRILHLDLDAFFVAIERLANPSLMGKAVVVGGSPEGRGVVASASYEARRFGVRSAMPMARALRFCPELIVVSAHHDRYAAGSREVMRILREYSPAVEPMSIDEAYVDLTGTDKLHGPAADGCSRLRQEIRNKLRLDTSFGLASSKLVAKMASDLAKPNGLMEVMPGREAEFLAPLPVSRIPGIGRVTNARLSEHGIRSIGDLVRLSDDQLEVLFGRYGSSIRACAKGEDLSPVEERETVKSIGHEETFATDTHDILFLSSKLYQLVEHSARRLRDLGCMARTVHLKLRYADFTTVFREVTLAGATDMDDEIFVAAQELLVKLLREDLPVRLIGVRLTNLVAGFGQMSLFELVDGGSRRRAVIQALDQIRSRFGYESILTGRVVRARPMDRAIEDEQGEEDYEHVQG